MSNDVLSLKLRAQSLTEKIIKNGPVVIRPDIKKRWQDYHHRLRNFSVQTEQKYIVGALYCVYELTINEIYELIGDDINHLYQQINDISRRLSDSHERVTITDKLQLSPDDQSLISSFINHLSNSNSALSDIDKIAGFYATIKAGFKTSSLTIQTRAYTEFIQQQAVTNKKITQAAKTKKIFDAMVINEQKSSVIKKISQKRNK